MGIYNPPEPPAHSGNAITDVQRAFGWAGQFFSLRAPVMRTIASAIKDLSSRVP